MHEKSQIAFFTALLDSAEFLNFTVLYGALKSLKILKKNYLESDGLF